MNRLATTFKHYYRTSALANGYWRRRHDRILSTGSFAQHGEDKVLLEMFPSGSTYIDIGANHPFMISNTYLLYRTGWRGVTVEPIRSLCKMHRRWRPDDITINAAVGGGGLLHIYELYPDVLTTASRDAAMQIEREGKGVVIADYDVPMITGRNIVADNCGDREVDVLSIDVEAYELEVLKSFDFTTFRPRSIIMEHHSFIPDEAAAAECAAFVEGLGYRSARVIGSNSIYTPI